LDYCLSGFLFQKPDTEDEPINEVESVRKIRHEMVKRLKV
jgi:hypothetical protein